MEAKKEPKREVRRAPLAGMCYGVRRAIDEVTELLSDGAPTYYEHKLVHNGPIIANLESKGFMLLGNLGGNEACKSYFVGSAHGLGPFTRQKYHNAGFTVLTTTCPKVVDFQRKAEHFLRRGYRVIIVGDSAHQEVKAVVEYLEWIKVNEDKTAVFSVLSSPDDAESIAPHGRKIALMGQTTIARKKLERSADRLIALGHEVEVVSTLCDSVEKRVAAAKSMAEVVQKMVVIGSIDISRNTKELYDAVKLYQKDVIVVETADKLDPKDFEGIHLVGVTAGASVDAETIKEVIERIEMI